VANSGRVVWYLSLNAAVSLTSFQAHPNGLYTLSNASEAFRVLDELGRDVDLITCVNRETRFHHIRVEQGGDYWIMCNVEQVMDLTSLGGLPAVNTIWTVVQHVSAEGSLLFEWNSFDHFAITDNPLSGIASATTINVTHGNAVTIDSDGNLIVSFRELNEITKIDTATGDVIWRFGGLANQFTLQGDPKGSFERQHGVVITDNGDIQFLDNGAVAPSRMVRYRLDEQALTARLVMEFIDSPTTYTPLGGSTQSYGNGNAMVSFGRAGRVVETTTTGSRAWELLGTQGQYVFRAQRIPSLYSAELGGPVP
jgi:outer membrane protein assembly factor BamB